ncbi:MAG: ABC transporter permease subunit [Bacteroides sp.]|nr:ABC transporter permease subunit [Bacteroides sp.]
MLISIPIVFYLNVYLKKGSRLSYFIRLTFDVLYGIPSIVYGAFGFAIMIALGLRTSLLGGIIVITLLIIPIFIRSMDEVASQLPRELLEATYSLGATRLETIKVVLYQIAPGIATATLLSIGRAIGDAAGVMFTAGFTDSIPTSLSQPAATLPLSIFFQLSSPSPEVRDRAYAAALLLTLIVLVLSISGRLITRYFSKNKI